MSAENAVIYERKGSIAFITLNRPAKLNAMNKAVVAGLKSAWDTLNKDEAARVAVLSGAGGRAFCSGADLNELCDPSRVNLAPALPGVGVEVWKPVIAAINGYCLGAGFVLAMLADIRIATEDAQFGYPEVKVGFTSGIGSALVNYLPRGLALEILLTGEPVGVRRAYEMGFVNRIVGADLLLDEAARMAGQIAENAPLVVTAMKKLCYLGSPQTSVETSAMVKRILAPAAESEDAKIGPRSKLEKRKPEFRGK